MRKVHRSYEGNFLNMVLLRHNSMYLVHWGKRWDKVQGSCQRFRDGISTIYKRVSGHIDYNLK